MGLEIDKNVYFCLLLIYVQNIDERERQRKHVCCKLKSSHGKNVNLLLDLKEKLM